MALLAVYHNMLKVEDLNFLCIVGRAHREKVPDLRPFDCDPHLLDIVLTKDWGSFETASVGGAQWYILFIDDYS